MQRDLAGRMAGYVVFLAAAMMLCMCSAVGPKGLQFADLPVEFDANPSALVPTQVGIQESRASAPAAPGSRLTPE